MTMRGIGHDGERCVRIAQRKSLSGWERKFHNHLALERGPSKQVRG